MIRTALRYHAPRSAEEASRILADQGPSAVVAGGGTTVVPAMGRGERLATDLVHLHRAGLSGIAQVDDTVELGATATYADVLVSPVVAAHAAVLQTLARGVTGGAALHNQGTLGGSACYANPSSDVPGALIALEAVLRTTGPEGVRVLPAAQFFLGPFSTALAPGEVLTTMVLPGGAATRSGYYKVKLCESSYPVATAAAVVREVAGQWRGRLALGGVRATPVDLDVTDLLDAAGVVPPGRYDEVGRRVTAELDEPWADEFAPGHYRRQIAPATAARALSRLAQDTSTQHTNAPDRSTL